MVTYPAVECAAADAEHQGLHNLEHADFRKIALARSEGNLVVVALEL